MKTELEDSIKNNCPFENLPAELKMFCSDSIVKYNELVIKYSFEHQLLYKNNLVSGVITKPDKYYEFLIDYSKRNLMIFPYHLSREIAQYFAVDPFNYYKNMLDDLLNGGKSYDSLPNFTAADCLQLLEIGRNQYIDIVVKSRSQKTLFFKKPNYKSFLPKTPSIWPASKPNWHIISSRNKLYTFEELARFSEGEAEILTKLNLAQQNNNYKDVIVGNFNSVAVIELFKKNLIQFDIEVSDNACFFVPTLENFVMNRVQGDYMESAMYKIFISLDSTTTPVDLSSILNIDLSIVKHAISLFCRLGLAVPYGLEKKKELLEMGKLENLSLDNEYTSSVDEFSTFSMEEDNEDSQQQQQHKNHHHHHHSKRNSALIKTNFNVAAQQQNATVPKRLGLVFDSSLSAFLMMGNLSKGLKSHAVTMFEVGKLTYENMPAFMEELVNIENLSDGEAQIYYLHAKNLLNTINFMITIIEKEGSKLDGVDLLSNESFSSLERSTMCKILQKRYKIVISLAPLLPNVVPLCTVKPYHFGPIVPEARTIWYRMYCAYVLGIGLPCLILAKGENLYSLPEEFDEYSFFQVTTYNGENNLVSHTNLLLSVKNMLKTQPIFVMAIEKKRAHFKSFLVNLPFPFDHEGEPSDKIGLFLNKIEEALGLANSFGYATLLFKSLIENESVNDEVYEKLKDYKCLDSDTYVFVSVAELKKNFTLDEDTFDVCLVEMNFGIPIFNSALNKKICQSIVSDDLLNETQCEKHNLTTNTHVVEFMEFIETLQGSSNRNISYENSSKFVAHLEFYPSKNVLLKQNKLSFYDNLQTRDLLFH